MASGAIQLAELKEAGYKVTVTHQRRYESVPAVETTAGIVLPGWEHRIIPTGGVTRVEIAHPLTPDMILATGVAQKVGYLYLMSFGKFVGYYVIKGKVSSAQSSMTNTEQTWSCGTDCTTVVESMGDDGSFGPNEGGDKGVFFFTSGGVMVETTLEWLYSDAPLSIKVPNLLK